MALLMLTFKMAEEFKSIGIKVNALMINRVKLSKETIQKMQFLLEGTCKGTESHQSITIGHGRKLFSDLHFG